MTYLISSSRRSELQQNWWVREFDSSTRASVTMQSKLLSKERERVTSATQLFAFELTLLEMHYRFEEKEKVAIEGFLRRHPFLVQILLDAANKIDSYFHEAQVFLNIAIDYETTDNNAKEVGNDEELAVSIATSMSPQEAIEQLKLFYSNWWSSASKEAKGKISIGLECL